VVIGASDAYAACTNPLQVYLEKRKEIPAWQPDEETQERLDLGLELEPVILSRYEKKEKCQVERNLPMFFSALHPFMGATPDGVARSLETAAKHGVEVKNSNWRMFDESGEDENKFGVEGTDQVPLRYFYQGQHQMAVLGLNRVDFPVLKNGNALKIYRLDRSEEFIAEMVSAQEELAQRILDGVPPEPTYSHSGTRKLLNEMYGCKTGTVTTLGLREKEAWLRLEEIRLAMKNLDDEKSELTNFLLASIGDAEFCEFSESDIRLKRIVVQDSLVTQEKVDKLAARLGEWTARGMCGCNGRVSSFCRTRNCVRRHRYSRIFSP